MSKNGAWNGKPVQRGNWGTWAQIEYGKGNRQSCYTCSHCNDGISCDLKNVIISEIGKGFWRQCDSYQKASEDISEQKPSKAVYSESETPKFGNYSEKRPRNNLNEQKEIGQSLIGRIITTKHGEKGKVIKVTNHRFTVLLENNSQRVYTYPISINSGEVQIIDEESKKKNDQHTAPSSIISITLEKQLVDLIEAAARRKNISVMAYIIKAIKTQLEIDGKTPHKR